MKGAGMAENGTLLQYLVSRVGIRRAVKVASFVVAWGIYSEKSGDDVLSMKGYSAYWRQSLALSYKEREMFRIAFPDDETPDRLWAFFRGVYRVKQVERSEKMSAQILSIRGDFAGG